MNRFMQEYKKQFVAIYQSALALTKSKPEPSYFRIVKMPDENDKCLYFQIAGKNVVLNMMPELIMRNDILLGFNRAEIALITHLGTKNEVCSEFKAPQNKLFKIIKQIFHMGKAKFLVEKDDGEIMEYNASELYENSIEAEKFNGVDGMKIGYTAAEEHHARLASLKKENKYV